MLPSQSIVPRLSLNSILFCRAYLSLRAASAMAVVLLGSASHAHGQMVAYETFRPVTSYYTPMAVGYTPMAAGYTPMAAGYPGGYVANYSPAGNYAAVTAFSPPVATAYVTNYPVAQVANYGFETSSQPVGVVSYYAPTAVAPTPMMAVPITTYYAPAAVAVPVYRRGLFGGLRPARAAMYIPY